MAATPAQEQGVGVSDTGRGGPWPCAEGDGTAGKVPQSLETFGTSEQASKRRCASFRGRVFWEGRWAEMPAWTQNMFLPDPPKVELQGISDFNF